MRKIVSVSGTSRPGNYTSHALDIVNSELTALGHVRATKTTRMYTVQGDYGGSEEGRGSGVHSAQGLISPLCIDRESL